MRRLSFSLVALIFFVLIAVACMQTIHRGEGPDLVFSHAGHFQQMGEECGTCHEGAEESVSATDRLLPGMDVCLQCHDMEAECAACHPRNPETAEPVPAPAEDLVFSHIAHLAQEMACGDCHRGVLTSHSIWDRSMPTMASCMKCHNGSKAPSDCATCHLNLDKGRLIPRDHDADWLTDHRIKARADQETCYACHRQSDCADCHQGRVDRKVHDRNFRYTHSLSARANPRMCGVCHETSFCQTCHGMR